jgi:hypothetical protein
MGGVLRVELLWVETFTGLRMRQFERLLKPSVNAAGADLVEGTHRCRVYGHVPVDLARGVLGRLDSR